MIVDQAQSRFIFIFHSPIYEAGGMNGSTERSTELTPKAELAEDRSPQRARRNYFCKSRR